MPPISLDQEHIKKLIKISKNAGDAIMDIYESEFEVNFKSDQSPLTKADILSNKIICQSLKKITPDIPILSEESSDIPYEQRSKWTQYWLIDPLDGTKEFIKKNGEFTVNIALIRNNYPVFGIIYCPVTNEIYYGSESTGSYSINTHGVIKKLKVSDNNINALRVMTSRSHPSKELNIFLNSLDNKETIVKGSSIKFCLVASGEADIYPRFGPTSEWDTAAGQAIVESSGGFVFDLDGQRIKYNMKECYLNPNFIVSNNKNFLQRMVDI